MNEWMRRSRIYENINKLSRKKESKQERRKRMKESKKATKKERKKERKKKKKKERGKTINWLVLSQTWIQVTSIKAA